LIVFEVSFKIMPKLLAEGITLAEFENYVSGGAIPPRLPTQQTLRKNLPDDELEFHVSIEWKNLTVQIQTSTGPKALLRGLSGHASPGELVAIMGPSGAGKTTMLNCIAQVSKNNTFNSIVFFLGGGSQPR
jgi:ABC-type multidrug transport system fused ATPase/permease subunit